MLFSSPLIATFFKLISMLKNLVNVYLLDEIDAKNYLEMSLCAIHSITHHLEMKNIGLHE